MTIDMIFSQDPVHAKQRKLMTTETLLRCSLSLLPHLLKAPLLLKNLQELSRDRESFAHAIRVHRAALKVKNRANVKLKRNCKR